PRPPASYMGMSHLPQIVQDLIKNGKAPSTPAAAVSMASTGSQRTVEAPLADLPTAVQNAGLHAPAIRLIGDEVGLRQQLASLEQRPLFGNSSLLARP